MRVSSCISNLVNMSYHLFRHPFGQDHIDRMSLYVVASQGSVPGKLSRILVSPRCSHSG